MSTVLSSAASRQVGKRTSAIVCRAMRRIVCLCILLFTFTAHAQERIERLLRHMTLEEKLGQLTQLVPDQPEFAPALQKGLVGSILSSGGVEQLDQMQRGLKVPLLVGYDVIHGYRTIFPIPLAIAS